MASRWLREATMVAARTATEALQGFMKPPEAFATTESSRLLRGAFAKLSNEDKPPLFHRNLKASGTLDSSSRGLHVKGSTRIAAMASEVATAIYPSRGTASRKEGDRIETLTPAVHKRAKILHVEREDRRRIPEEVLACMRRKLFNA